MKLASYMVEQGLSPQDMADRLRGVSLSAVVKWMRDERTPRAEQMRRVYEATGGQVTPNDFVLGSIEQSEFATAPAPQQGAA